MIFLNEPLEGCLAFRDTLHRYLDEDLELVDQASFVGHMAVCEQCRTALLQFAEHIQAHRILAAGGRLDSDIIRSLEKRVPPDFSSISKRVIRQRARSLGRLKAQILQAYLKSLTDEHAWPTLLNQSELNDASTTSEVLIGRIEHFKESDVIFADGGPVDVRMLREVLGTPSPTTSGQREAQLWHIARGLLTARTLDPGLDEYVLHHLGLILEQLGYHLPARQMYLTLAELTPQSRAHLRAKALNSAGRASLRFLGEFDRARGWLEEADRLFPHRWTIEYNLASLFLWEGCPFRSLESARRWFDACRQDSNPSQLAYLLEHDAPMREACEAAGFLPPASVVKPPEVQEQGGQASDSGAAHTDFPAGIAG